MESVADHAPVEESLKVLPLEEDLSLAIYSFERDVLGSHYSRIRVSCKSHRIIARLEGGYHSPAEQHIARSVEGQAYLQGIYRELFDSSRDQFVRIVWEIVGLHVKEVFSEIDILGGTKSITCSFIR